MASFMSFNSPGLFEASALNNEAGRFEASGNFTGAEQKHLEALRMKISTAGENSIPVALTKNALGELYLKMNELDKAQTMLEAAERVRSGIRGQEFDAACSRDNLGRLWEMKGQSEKAGNIRSKKADEMICSHFDVSSCFPSAITCSESWIQVIHTDSSY